MKHQGSQSPGFLTLLDDSYLDYLIEMKIRNIENEKKALARNQKFLRDLRKEKKRRLK